MGKDGLYFKFLCLYILIFNIYLSLEYSLHCMSTLLWLPGLVARLDECPPGILMVTGSSSSPGKHFFIEIGHEIISKAILSLPLIQVEQLSVTGKRMCTKYWLTA